MRRAAIAVIVLAGCSKPPASAPALDMSALCTSLGSEVGAWEKSLAGSNVSCAQLARTGRLALGVSLGVSYAVDASPGAGSAAQDFAHELVRQTNAWGIQSDVCLDLGDATVAANNVRTTVEEAKAKLANTRAFLDQRCHVGSAK